jgi:hypothetical protein
MSSPIVHPDRVTGRPSPKPNPKPRAYPNDFILKNQAGLRRANPSWALIEQVVTELEPRSDNKFAILEKKLNWSYVQTLRVPEGWLIEWRVFFDRDPNCYHHFRAETLQSSLDPDLCTLDQAIETFRAFFQSKMPPSGLNWRTLEI